MVFGVKPVGRTDFMQKPRSITATRLLERMDEIGVSQEMLASAIGCQQSTISRILTGESQNSRWLPKIAHNLAVNLNWVMGVTDQKIDMVDIEGESISEDTLAAMRAGVVENRLQKPEQLASAKGLSDRGRGFKGFPVEAQTSAAELAEEMGMVAVRELDLAFGMGATFLDVPVTERVRYFPREWLRQFTKAPADQLAWVQGVGDSMAPTLLDSDTLLLDLSSKTLTMSDQIWALAYHQLGMVKRLRPSSDGGLRLISDNPIVEDLTAYDDEAQLIGRIVAFLRKL